MSRTPLRLPETRLLELLHVELDVLLGHQPAEAGLFRGFHKESSCKQPLVSDPTPSVRGPSNERRPLQQRLTPASRLPPWCSFLHSLLPAGSPFPLCQRSLCCLCHSRTQQCHTQASTSRTHTRTDRRLLSFHNVHLRPRVTPVFGPASPPALPLPETKPFPSSFNEVHPSSDVFMRSLECLQVPAPIVLGAWKTSSQGTGVLLPGAHSWTLPQGPW